MQTELEPAEAQLWHLWRTEADDAARQQLLDLHLPYARVVAASYFARRMNDEIEFADYLQLACMGMVESVQRFDPSFGVQFRTFAARRMHGALIDGIEHMTEKQQQIAACRRLEEQRRAAIKSASAPQAGVQGAQRSADQVLQYVAEVGLAFALAWLLDGTGMLQQADKSQAVPFYRNLELQQLREQIVAFVCSLPEQERRVVQEHYFQQQRFDHIAERMQLSTGRISQIHKRALQRLRGALGERRNLDVSG